MKVLREDNTEVDMKENIDEATISYNSVMSEDKNYNQNNNEDFGKLGYQTQQISEDGFEDVAPEEDLDGEFEEELILDESYDDSIEE